MDGGQLLEVSVEVDDEVGHAELMHDRDELCSEPGLHITGDVFYGGGDGVLGGERGVHNDAQAFDLEVSFVQSFEGAPIVEVMIEWYGQVGVGDGGDECGMFGGGRKRAEAVAMDRDVDREDGGNFYSSWR